jgi:hypothetical protein
LTLQSPFNPFMTLMATFSWFRRSPRRHSELPFRSVPNTRSPSRKVGADLNVVGSQWLVGDESNQNPKVAPYWVVNLHSSYKVTDNVEVFGLVRNLFDQHYNVFGTFFDVTSFPYLNLTDPRTFVPGMPLAVTGRAPTEYAEVALLVGDDPAVAVPLHL